ncbi:unnamed protein product [Calypogeia fissa]
MRNRACTAGTLGATECSQRACGPGCQGGRTVLRSGPTVPEFFQIDKYHNVATSLRETNNRSHGMYSQGRSLHHPLCTCGNCNRGHRAPETAFKDLLCRQSVGVGGGNSRLHSSQPHSHSQQNGYDHGFCGSGPNFYQGKRSADNLMERMRSSPRSSVFSGSGDIEQRNAAASAGFMSHVPFRTKANEWSSSSLDTTSKRNFQCSQNAPPGASKNQISLHGWYLMKPISGDNTAACLQLPAVAVGGYRTPQMLQTEFVQTARVEQRLEKSKLRTSDGLEVTLVGMIDLHQSIANGFSPAILQHFRFGFPPTWIFLMLNQNLRGSRPDLPSSSAQQKVDNLAGNSQEHPVEPNPGFRTPTAPLFTPPSEGTWREALRSFSPTTLNSLHDGSSDVNITQQCDLDHEPSEGQRNCPKSHQGADPQVESSCLQRQTPSSRDCPRSEPEAMDVENTDKVPDGSSQTGKPTLPRPRRPGLQGAMAGEAADVGKDPESSLRQKSGVVKDVPVDTLCEDVNEVPECSREAQETQVVGVCPNSTMNVEACCEGPQNAATEEGTGVIDVDDLIVYPEDFAVDTGHETELPSVQVPFTPLQTCGHRMEDLNEQNTENSTGEIGTDPVQSLQTVDSGRKLRSGRCLLAVDKQVRGQGIVREHATQNTKTRKRSRNLKTLFTEGCEDVMHSREPISSTDNLLVHHEETGNLGGLDRAPSTPSQNVTERVNIGPGSTAVVHTPTTDGETQKVTTQQNADDTKKLRSGRLLRTLDKLIQDAVVSPVIVPQSLKSRKRRRSAPSAAPVPDCEDDSIECEGPPCSAVIEEQDTKVDKLQGYVGDSEVWSTPKDEFCRESAGVNRPVNKKRHGTVSKLYKSRRKKSSTANVPTSKPKLETSRSDSCKSPRKNFKVGVDKSVQMGEAKPTSRKNSTKVHQPSKTTCKAEPNRATSQRTSQAEKEVQSAKPNSIVPPPLPAPRVADESKVIKAYGLKKSRFGRIIVPPLAVWCNQSIIYDTDGSIIAISDASSPQAESQTGCFNYTVPSDTGARKLQIKLLKAARIDWSLQNKSSAYSTV